MTNLIIFLVAAMAFGVCKAKVSTEHTAIPEMSLKYFKESGFVEAMTNGTTYVNKFIKDIMRKERPLSEGEEKADYVGFGAQINATMRSAVSIQLDHAACEPSEQVVKLPNDLPNVLLYPSCVKLRQCGGCCLHSALECGVTAATNKTISVLKYVYDGSTAQPQPTPESIVVQEHTDCQCQCRIKEEDCNLAIHDYDDFDCRCKCKTMTGCPSNKRWDDNLCRCVCAVVPPSCGVGYQFNMETCRCEASLADSGSLLQSNVNPFVPYAANVKHEDKQSASADSCAHLSCQRRYKKVKTGGTCRCKFDRMAGRYRLP